MESKTPLVFANQVIRRFVDNLLGSDMIVLPEDYLAIRTAFRKLGGSWEKVHHGDLGQIEGLTKILKAWGKMPQRKKEVEV